MSEPEKKTLSIVIPVYNERETIEDILNKVSVARLPDGWRKEIIVVDDASTDGTKDILNSEVRPQRLGLRGEASEVRPQTKIIFRSQNGGKGAALKDGFRAATGDYLLIQDADAEYDPADYSKLVQPIIKGEAEVVFGSRTLKENNVSFSQIYFYGGLFLTKIFNIFFGAKLTDLATCYKVFPRKYVDELLTMPADDFVFDVVELSYVLLRKAKKIVEVPISYASRKKVQGKKLNWRHGWRCFRRMISLFIIERSTRLWQWKKERYQACTRFIARTNWMPVFLTFAFFFAVFFVVYFSVSTLSSGDDHFFHFRFAQQMLSNGFFHSFQDFKEIYFSKMAQGNAYFTYYNFLFYLVIIPFTFITPLFLGIKLYAVFAAAIAFTLLYWCLKKFEIKHPFIWTVVILAITNTTSIWRFFLSRPYALAPSLLLLLLYFLYRKKYIGVFILCFFYLFWHSSTFFLPACVAITYYVIEWFYGKKGDWKNLTAALGGTLVAVGGTYLVSSGFLLFIKDTIFNIYWETILGKKVNIAEGVELYPVDFFNFIQGNALMFAAFVTALATDIFSWISYRWKKASPREYFAGLSEERRHLQTTVLVLTAGFFLGTIVASGRFGDYFTFFAALYIALSFDYARRLVTVSGASMIKRSLATGLGIVLVYLFTSNMLFLQQKIAYGQSPYEFYPVGHWLAENSKPGDIVFEANWSWFPQLYYWSPNDYYSSGLEPRFMYDYSQKLYWESVHVTQGYACDQSQCPDMVATEQAAFRQGTSTVQYAKTEGDKIAGVLANDFHAAYVVSSKDYQVFNYILSNNPHFKKEIYDAQTGYILFGVKP